MPTFSAFESLPFAEQILHGLHFMLCAFAVLIGCVPLLTAKGSTEHKFAGFIYLPLSMVALLLASFMAWKEASMVLFCFNCFCAYLLLSGWRAVHESDKPKTLDWMIPVSLFTLAGAVLLHALINDEGRRSFFLMFFAMNAFYLSWRDYKHLQRRALWSRQKVFFADTLLSTPQATAWIGRHIAGMVGSLTANLSVVVLTLLPLSLHWLWPVTLLVIGAWIAMKERAKRQRVANVIKPMFEPAFARRRAPRPPDRDDFRKAA